MKPRRAIIVSGLPGSGKSTLSEMLAEKLDGHHVIFPRVVGGNKPKNSTFYAIAAIVRHGREKAVRKGLTLAHDDFIRTGKTTLVIDGAVHPKDLDILSRIDPELKIQVIHINGLPTRERALRIQFRTRGNWRGSALRSNIWLRIMGALHYPALGLADLKEMAKKGSVIENKGTRAQLLVSALYRLKDKNK